jgi:hypothetical protein
VTVGPIVTREEIARRAAQAARDTGAGLTVANPYPLLSDAAAAWEASYERALVAELADCEASA